MALTNTFDSLYKSESDAQLELNPPFYAQIGSFNNEQELIRLRDTCEFDGGATHLNCITKMPFRVNQNIEFISLFVPAAFDGVDITVQLADKDTLVPLTDPVFTYTGTASDANLALQMPLEEYIDVLNEIENLVFVVSISSATAGTIYIKLLLSEQ